MTQLPETETPPLLDSLVPKEMASKAELLGVKKANTKTFPLFLLSILAGAFIAFGAVLATVVSTSTEPNVPFGLSKLITGLSFSLGLILVIIGGAELFTGNNLIIMAWASKKISTKQVLKNWALVYVGNFLGSLSIVILVFFSGHLFFGSGAVGKTALNIANHKVSLGFVEAVMLGILCNILVCLAVWLTLSARTTTCKILSIVPPITAFVACGFEHSIANMYFVPQALMIKNFATSTFWQSAQLKPDHFPDLTGSSFLMTNLLPVTIGNMIGGVFLVGVVYWGIYLRSKN